MTHQLMSSFTASPIPPIKLQVRRWRQRRVTRQRGVLLLLYYFYYFYYSSTLAPKHHYPSVLRANVAGVSN